MNFHKQYENYRAAFEEMLKEETQKMNFRPAVLGESMRYSLLVGGKRLRPVLFFACLDAFGGDWKEERNLALALECIHTYSLIHDDLPAMDNDDMRRGKPSNHKQFGEANAILAGDALLSHAIGLMLANGDERHLRAARRLASAAGPNGMIAGQSADLLLTGKGGTEDELFYMYEKKTGELIAAPAVMASILAGRDENAAEDFGRSLGILFQLTDDILDETEESATLGKTAGKDRAEGKFTAIRVFGLARANELADEYAANCIQALERMGIDHGFLHELVAYVRSRRS